MGLKGFTPATLDDYETFRTRQVPLAGVNTEKNYRLVGRIASPEIPTALIDAHNLHIRLQSTGQVALSGLLLSDEFNDGVRFFQMYEAPDESARETLYPFKDGGIQLLIHELGRIHLMYGYLISTIDTPAPPIEHPHQLQVHHEETERI